MDSFNNNQWEDSFTINDPTIYGNKKKISEKLKEILIISEKISLILKKNKAKNKIKMRVIIRLLILKMKISFKRFDLFN